MSRIFKYVVADILRSRIVLVYGIFLLLVSFSIFNLEDVPSKGILSMLNIILMVVPLVSIIFPTIYVYNSAEFIELLLSQPIKRSVIWTNLFVGLASALGIAFLIGVGIVILFFSPDVTGILLVLCGLFLTFIFTALAMLAAVMTRDKAKGVGFAILLWLCFGILFDGLVLLLMFQLADYPIEHFMILVSMLNPIDLSRILILMQLDVSALMGYTGAIFRDFFGQQTGMVVSALVMLLWVIIPFAWSLAKFRKKDL